MDYHSGRIGGTALVRAEGNLTRCVIVIVIMPRILELAGLPQVREDTTKETDGRDNDRDSGGQFVICTIRHVERTRLRTDFGRGRRDGDGTDFIRNALGRNAFGTDIHLFLADQSVLSHNDLLRRLFALASEQHKGNAVCPLLYPMAS